MARGDGGAQFARAPARVNAPDFMSAEDEKSPTIFEAAADEEITESHWEYHCRRTRNDGKGDAVYTNLAYVPVCNCMPVCKSGCRNPLWMWTKKS